ncbi:MAG: CofH family radical SAM protein [Phycisphaerales bacterium JB043]
MTSTLTGHPALSDNARDRHLEPIRDRVLEGARLSIEDGERLYETPDIWGVLELGDLVRRRMHSDRVYYNINRHINYSNVCALSCAFCEFYRKRGDEGAYELDVEEIANRAREAQDNGATEVHIVGGLHPFHPFEYYTDMMCAIRKTAPLVHIKAFTAVEIVHLARIAKQYKSKDREVGIRWVLERLKEAGLGSLPGGGAEVFDDRVHDEAFKSKIRSDVWLDVHRVAHEIGLNTNATILYGHIDSRRERLVHMDILRRAQDEALRRIGYDAREDGSVSLHHEGARLPSPDDLARGGYFQTLTPLPFFPDGSEIEHLPGPSGLENLRTLAIARLMLDNFPHIKAFWIMQTLPMSQLQLRAGADDIDGTVVWYDITKVGGTTTHQEVSVRDLHRAIIEAGCVPVERDTLYRSVHRDGATWRLASEPALS